MSSTLLGAAAAIVLPLVASPVALAADEPAGGAPTEDLVPAALAGAALAVAAVAFGERHRRARTRLLTRLAGIAERVSGMPGWVALPSLLAAIAMVTACFGFYWDVATHIDNGRDAGPFANASHFFILGGLGGIVLSGYLAVLLGTGERTPTSTSLRPAGTRRSAARSSSCAGGSRSPASRSTTSGTGCSGRTSPYGARPTSS